MKENVVRARIDRALKAQAAAVLAACGLEMSAAIRLFLHQVVASGGMPFPIRGQPRVRRVAPRRLRTMKTAAQARDRALAAREDLSDGRMLLIRPELARGAKIRWPTADLCD
jgi:DNA-damage-inducible protein J